MGNAEVTTSHEDSEHTDESKTYHEIKNDIQVDIYFVEVLIFQFVMLPGFCFIEIENIIVNKLSDTN